MFQKKSVQELHDSAVKRREWEEQQSELRAKKALDRYIENTLPVVVRACTKRVKREYARGEEGVDTEHIPYDQKLTIESEPEVYVRVNRKLAELSRGAEVTATLWRDNHGGISIKVTWNKPSK